LRDVLDLRDPDRPVSLEIKKIRRDGGTQPRAELNQDTIAEYAEDMQNGDDFPPGLVFHDGTDYWLARGFTRTAAAESIGWTEFDYIVRQGTRRDAVLFSVGENADHGLRRTNDDKRRAVLVMLQDDEWGQLSSEIIAKYCRVSHTLVNNIRRSLATVASQGGQGSKTSQKRVGADGRQYDIKRIQKTAQKRAKPMPQPAPEPEPAYDDDGLPDRHMDDEIPGWNESPATAPSDNDEKRWIVDQLHKLAGMLDRFGRPGDARVLRGVLSVLAREWGRK
jgi:hypothetical protein